MLLDIIKKSRYDRKLRTVLETQFGKGNKRQVREGKQYIAKRERGEYDNDIVTFIQNAEISF